MLLGGVFCIMSVPCFSWFIVLLNSFTSLLICCLDASFITESGVLMSPAITMQLSISLFSLSIFAFYILVACYWMHTYPSSVFKTLF